MCGILGWLKNSNNITDVDTDKFNSGLTQLQHRGPNNSSYSVIDHKLLLGHARLSILDLSSAGNQPMKSHDESWIIAFNGEIYNFKDLREELPDKSFRTGTDTEVLLEALTCWQTKTFEKLNGMFAFAAYHKQSNKLYIVRDRLGIKPLYMYEGAEGLIFCSEIKALKPLLDSSLGLNTKALHEWAYYGNVLGEETLFESITSLPPGSFWEIDLGSGRKTHAYYWKPEDVASEQRPDGSELISSVRDHLEQAVRRQMVSDVPLGVLLSGGIDSSAITAFAAKQLESPLKTFSVAFDFDKGQNELPNARLVAKKFKTDHHEFNLRGQDVIDSIETMVSSHDLPFSDAANLPLYLITRQIKDEVKVILQGDGGDELFAGYKRYNILSRISRWNMLARISSPFFSLLPRNAKYYSRKRYLNLLRSNDPAERMALLLTVEDKESSPLIIFSQAVRDKIADVDPFAHYRQCYERFKQFDPVHCMLMTDSQIILPDIFLEKVDRSTMANSVEVRVPFLDHDLVDFVMPLSGKQRMMKHGQKGLLKEALKGIVPDEILFGPKRGFGVPFGFWLKTSLKEFFYDHLESLDDYGKYLLDKDAIEKLMQEHISGSRDRGFLLWKTMNLMIWLKQWKF